MTRAILVALLCAACEPDYDGTALRCDQAHTSCPLDQQCIGGRCRRQAPVAIACGQVTCGPAEQCCSDGNRCIGAGELCASEAALCDSPDDCAANERCCGDRDLVVCALVCQSDSVVCATDDDCPSDARHCCPELFVPWGKCSELEC